MLTALRLSYTVNLNSSGWNLGSGYPLCAGPSTATTRISRSAFGRHSGERRVAGCTDMLLEIERKDGCGALSIAWRPPVRFVNKGPTVTSDRKRHPGCPATWQDKTGQGRLVACRNVPSS